MRVSTIRDTVICPVCQLHQYERGNGICRRCHHSLGTSYIEVFLSDSPTLADGNNVNAIYRGVGALIRKLRTRYGLTQGQLASLTGLHRTYLSRVEGGKVMPSVINLVQIAHAVGIDKVLIRVRCSSVHS